MQPSYIATIEEVDEQIAIVEEFIKMVETYCNEQLALLDIPADKKS